MKSAVIFIPLFLVVLASGCSRPKQTAKAIVVGSETGMLYVAHGSVKSLDLSATQVERVMADTLQLLNDEKPDSEIAKVNKVSESVQLPVSRVVLRAIELARQYHYLTGGAFDITTGQLERKWSEGGLTHEAVTSSLARTGMQHMEVSDTGAIAFTTPGIMLTPGRYAFAYALDMAIVERRKVERSPCIIIWPDVARRDGILPENETPLVPVTAPGIKSHPNIGAFELRNAASLAVVYQPEPDTGKMPVIDPRTGYPATNNLVAAVCGPLTVKAYALARALLILGPDEGGELLADFPGYEAMVMPDRKRTTLRVTPGFEVDFTPDPFYRGKSEPWDVAGMNPAQP